MKQILTIADKEFRSAFRNRMFLIITALFILLSIASVYIGSSTKNAEMAAYNNVLKLLKSQGALNFPASPAIYPLAILRNIITYISMIGSVLVIFLGFDSFSGERDNGTARLILTRPVYRDQLFIGKLLGSAAVVALLLLATLVTNIVLFTAVAGIFPTGAELCRLVMFILTAFLYLLTVLTITFFVSIRSKDRTFGFLTMMVIWLFMSFVIPQLAQTQRDFAMSLNSTGQAVTTVATDTAASRAIEIFSPSVQFENTGKNLLQAVDSTADLSPSAVMAVQWPALLLVLVPGIIFFILSYMAVQKEEL